MLGFVDGEVAEKEQHAAVVDEVDAHSDTDTVGYEYHHDVVRGTHYEQAKHHQEHPGEDHGSVAESDSQRA